MINTVAMLVFTVLSALILGFIWKNSFENKKVRAWSAISFVGIIYGLVMSTHFHMPSLFTFTSEAVQILGGCFLISMYYILEFRYKFFNKGLRLIYQLLFILNIVLAVLNLNVILKSVALVLISLLTIILWIKYAKVEYNLLKFIAVPLALILASAPFTPFYFSLLTVISFFWMYSIGIKEAKIHRSKGIKI